MSELPYISLINNTALLLVMGALYGSLRKRSDKPGWLLICGVVMGMVGIGVMLNPWELAPGIFVDTRSILLSVGGLFLGFVATAVAMLMTGVYRIYVGGPGSLTGVLWIILSGLLGLGWQWLRKRPAYQMSGGEFYLFGLFAHILLLLLTLTMPSQHILPILKAISLPILLVFPVGTVLLAKLLATHELRAQDRLELDKSERQYRDLVEHSQAIILRLDRQGRCLFANEFAQKFFGFSEAELLGRSLLETIVPQTDSTGRDLHTQITAIFQQPERFPFNENENICRDGRRVRILWKNVPVWDASGKFVGSQTIGFDLTEQRRAEAALLIKERQFRHLIEVLPVPLVVQEPPEAIVYLNQKFVELFGYNRDDIPTLADWWRLAYPDANYREGVQRQWQAAVARLMEGDGTEMEPQEFRVTGKDGKVRDILFLVSTVGGQNVVILNDMTREREIERMKREFLATAAHELNTPLTTIAGFTEILLEENDFTPDQQREYLAIVYEKTETLGKIIEDLLNIGRVESGRIMHLQMEPSDLVEVVSAAVKSYRKEFPQHEFTLSWPDSLPREIRADPDKIGQVMENLLSNAVKYSPGPGTIHVAAKLVDNEIQVEVTDQGVGMTPGQLARVFERFYRADYSDTAASGMGLGMSIVKNIIDAHNGRVWVESTPGQGTKVSFALPLTSPTAVS